MLRVATAWASRGDGQKQHGHAESAGGLVPGPVPCELATALQRESRSLTAVVAIEGAHNAPLVARQRTELDHFHNTTVAWFRGHAGRVLAADGARQIVDLAADRRAGGCQ